MFSFIFGRRGLRRTRLLFVRLRCQSKHFRHVPTARKWRKQQISRKLEPRSDRTVLVTKWEASKTHKKLASFHQMAYPGYGGVSESWENVFFKSVTSATLACSFGEFLNAYQDNSSCRRHAHWLSRYRSTAAFLKRFVLFCFVSKWTLTSINVYTSYKSWREEHKLLAVHLVSVVFFMLTLNITLNIKGSDTLSVAENVKKVSLV